jgi:hypothetical protein
MVHGYVLFFYENCTAFYENCTAFYENCTAFYENCTAFYENCTAFYANCTKDVITFTGQNVEFCTVTVGHTFLIPTNSHILFITQYSFFIVKSVQHVSDPYSGTIIRDPYRESHKITNQQIMVHIKISKVKM